MNNSIIFFPYLIKLLALLFIRAGFVLKLKKFFYCSSTKGATFEETFRLKISFLSF